MPTDSDPPIDLGPSGELKISWHEIARLRELAERFHKFEGELPPEGDQLRRYGLGRPYSDYLWWNAATWGAVVPSRPLFVRCLERGLIGIDRHMLHDVTTAIHDAAELDTPVLICGETGTGKELVAKAIHDEGRGEDKPFIPVNCAGVPSELLESELFGHKKGAFTGAISDRKGFFEQADRGSILLDEIGDMPQLLQAKVLRVLNDGEVVPVGSESPTDREKVDVRVIAATNRDVDDPEVLRTDLYYRLNTTEIHLWPLNLRPGDLVLLAYYFIQDWNRGKDFKIRAISSAAIEDLMCYDWPGNARELRSVIEKACSTARHRLENSDTIAGLDVDHAMPGAYEWGAGTRITLDELLAMDVYKFMEQRDEDLNLWPEFRGSWKLPARYRRLLGERSPETTGNEETADSSSVSGASVPRTTVGDSLKRTPYKEALEDFKHAYVNYHFRANGGDKTRTAKAIGVDRSTVARYVEPAKKH